PSRGNGTRGSISEKPPSSLVEDPDDPARAWLHDHTAIVDDRIAIFAMPRHRPQFDGRRQRLTNNDLLTDHDRAIARDRCDHGVRNFHGCADRRTHGAADDGADRATYFAAPR